MIAIATSNRQDDFIDTRVEAMRFGQLDLFRTSSNEPRSTWLEVEVETNDVDDTFTLVEEAIHSGHALAWIRASLHGWSLRFHRQILDSVEGRRVAAETAMGAMGPHVQTKFKDDP